MKKILLSFIAAFGVTAASYAQTLLTLQDFEAPTVVPNLPATWSQGSTGSPAWQTGTTAGSTWGSLTAAYNLPAHSTYVYIDDAAHPTQLHDTLMSPVFSISGSNVWLNYDYFFYNATQSSTGLTETCYILGSTDGGSTWAIIDSVFGNGWNGAWSTGHSNLTITGANCRIAFAYSDGGGSILGVALDNITVLNLTQSAMGITALGYNSITNGISTNGNQVSFLAQNNGIPVTSFVAYYTLNGGGYVSQTFSPAGFTPYSSQVFTFTTPMAGAVAGTNTLHVGIPTVNTIVNAENAADSVANSSFTLASAQVQRQGLVEEFSSSTCNPCMAFNSSYDPLCLSTLNADVAGSNFNIIKYQMNWPSPGTDRSYNADGDTRKTYYNVNGIPEHFVNGVTSNLPWSYPFTSANTTDFTAEAAGSSANKSFIDMSVSYTIDTFRKKLGVTLHVTPHFTKTGGYHVYTALLDVHYQNTTNTTGQLDYYHAMRMMVPTASGHSVSSWTDGTAQTFTDTGITYVNGDWTLGSGSYPVQMDNKFWSNPLLGSQLVAFVEEDATKSVMQSILAFPTSSGVSHVSVSTLSNVDGIVLYPNPAKEEATVSFNLHADGNVNVKVIDYSGRTVSDVMNGELKTGTQNVTVRTANIPAGDYLVLISTEGGSNIQRFSVIK